jgi:NAD(P)-dependent dehydrogenase (short-subunit alcohol dehydrogenase family)
VAGEENTQAGSITPPLPSALRGSNVLLIGGSSGIGAAAAQLLLGVGARVTLAARSSARLRRAADELQAASPSADRPATLELDVNDPDAIRDVLDRVRPVDHILLSAAETPHGPLLSTALEDVRAVLESRVYALYQLARLLPERMTPAGSLTLVSGALVDRPMPGFAMTAASVGGIESMARVLALELAPIRVNVLRPGFTDTGRFREGLSSADASKLGGRVPAGRVGRPEEVAAGALSCMANPYMTGSIIQVDGGLSLV